VRYGIIVFPGSNGDADCYHVVRDAMGAEAEYIWHQDATIAADFDCLLLPGGAAHGDALRPGAIARLAPVMQAVKAFAKNGGLVMGIGNGFQILCEVGLLPGAFLPNRDLRFESRSVHLRVETNETPFTAQYKPGHVVELPIAHRFGNYFVDEAELATLEAQGQIVFRYSDAAGELADAANPNGSRAHIAGVSNARRNVLGMMAHPERAAEGILGNEDGRLIFASIVETLAASGRVQEV